jgi:CheY-like chemotaxis protein
MSPTTVLVVDDQEFIRQTMAKALTSDGSHVVLQAIDGMAAITSMRDSAMEVSNAAGTDLMENASRPKVKIDCIVSDINMQPMNGLEFVKAIRIGLAGIARDTPVIMFTGHAEKYFLAAAIALDVSGFLVKPVSVKLLRERIKRAIDTHVALKSPSDYATLIIPDIERDEQWSSGTRLGKPMVPVRASDLIGRYGGKLPHVVPLMELKTGDRLSNDLLTREGVMVVPRGTKVVPALITSIKDLSEIVELQQQVAVFQE